LTQTNPKKGLIEKKNLPFLFITAFELLQQLTCESGRTLAGVAAGRGRGRGAPAPVLAGLRVGAGVAVLAALARVAGRALANEVAVVGHALAGVAGPRGARVRGLWRLLELAVAAAEAGRALAHVRV